MAYYVWKLQSLISNILNQILQQFTEPKTSKIPIKISGAQLQNRHSNNSRCNRLHENANSKNMGRWKSNALLNTYSFHKLTDISFRQN